MSVPKVLPAGPVAHSRQCGVHRQHRTSIGADALHNCAVSMKRTALSEAVSTNNVGLHNYNTYGRTIRSYLTEEADGSLTRVETSNSTGLVAAERYEREGDTIQWKSDFTLDYELPLFGGYYSNDQYNFLVFGASNPYESDSTEVIRVVKYSKDWSTRISTAALCGTNTTIPFDLGSLRFAEYGGYLYIRTSHQMYTDSKGIRHQANLTFQIDIESMEITDEFSKTMNVSYGYVSHSFNQFIAAKDGTLVAVDHGDTYPRSIVMIKYAKAAGESTFTDVYGNCTSFDILDIAGSLGDNVTRATVGALEATEDAWLVAGNSVVQDSNFRSNSNHNI